MSDTLTTGVHHDLLGDKKAEQSCAYAALDVQARDNVGSVIDAYITHHPEYTPTRSEKIEGIVLVRRPNAPHADRERATLQFTYNRRTGGIDLFWGHYDLRVDEAHADFAERIQKA